MRAFLVFKILFYYSNSLCSQLEDTIVYKSENIIIEKKVETNRYSIRNELTNQLLTDLKFIKRISSAYQVLDSNNKIYYLNEKFEKKDSIYDPFLVCGTVPHYELTIKEDKKSFLIMEDETFFDSGNKVPPVEIYRVPKRKADKVFFINGQSKFDFTSNFGTSTWVTIDPRTIIIVKNGFFSFLKHPERIYDTIFFFKNSWSLITQKNNLFGYYGIVEPKYKAISEITYFLATVTFEDGKIGYIDYLGNEYK
jgi:hypothetical protein